MKAGAATLVVIEPEADDAFDVPIKFVALTVSVYEVDGLNPVTLIVPLPA